MPYVENLYIDRQAQLEREARVRNTRGTKRPLLRAPSGRMTPVPWVGGGFPGTNEWKRVDGDRASVAERDHLCIVCGLDRGDNWVYAALNGETVSDHAGFSLFGELPSPTYGHPGCILKAVLFCPHFKNLEYPAMKQDRRTPLTVDNLKTMIAEEKKKLDKTHSFAIGRSDTKSRKSPVRISY